MAEGFAYNIRGKIPHLRCQPKTAWSGHTNVQRRTPPGLLHEPVRMSSWTRKLPASLAKLEVGAAPPAIDAHNVSLILGQAEILIDCSLKVPQGSLWMLLGPNGCGKSSLLKVLAGLLPPNSGSVEIDTPLSFVFQNPDHQVVMPTVEADVAFGLGNQPLPLPEVKQRVAAALQAVGLEGFQKRQVSTLSGGQKQRVAIAGALAEAAHVLLLDELTTFLDAADQMAVVDAVRRVVDGSQGVTALWVTHRLEELRFADGAAYMEDGQIVFSGPVQEVKGYIAKYQQRQRGMQ